MKSNAEIRRFLHFQIKNDPSVTLEKLVEDLNNSCQHLTKEYLENLVKKFLNQIP